MGPPPPPSGAAPPVRRPVLRGRAVLLLVPVAPRVPAYKSQFQRIGHNFRRTLGCHAMGARTGREAEKEEGATAVGRSVTKGLLDLFVPHLPHGHSQQRRLPPADVEAGSPAGHPSRQSVVLLSMGLVGYLSVQQNRSTCKFSQQIANLRRRGGGALQVAVASHSQRNYSLPSHPNIWPIFAMRRGQESKPPILRMPSQQRAIRKMRGRTDGRGGGGGSQMRKGFFDSKRAAAPPRFISAPTSGLRG